MLVLIVDLSKISCPRVIVLMGGRGNCFPLHGRFVVYRSPKERRWREAFFAMMMDVFYEVFPLSIFNLVWV